MLKFSTMVKKPSGLAASRKKQKIAVVGSAPTPPPTSSSTASPLPLDSDSLTLSDCFELQNSALVLLEGERSDEVDEEASGLLRGILHAVSGLENYMKLERGESRDGAVAEGGISTGAVAAEITTEVEVEGEGPITPPTLIDLGIVSPLSYRQLVYLQAFALHNLAAILPPAPSIKGVLASRIASSSSSTSSLKKRKLNADEPNDPVEWLEAAMASYSIAIEGIQSFRSVELGTATEENTCMWHLFILSEFMRCASDLRRRTSKVAPSSRSSTSKAHWERFPSAAGTYISYIPTLIKEIPVPVEASAHSNDDDETSIPLSIPRVLSTLLSSISDVSTAIECDYDSQYSPDRGVLFRQLGTIVESLSVFPQIELPRLMRLCEVKLAEFTIMEEKVEETYRPDDEDDSDNEEPEEEDEMPEDLPDEPLVRLTKELGEEGEASCYLVLLDER